MCHPPEGLATLHMRQTDISFRQMKRAGMLGIIRMFRPESAKLWVRKPLVHILFLLPKRGCKPHMPNTYHLLIAFPGLHTDGAHIFYRLRFTCCMEDNRRKYHQGGAVGAHGIYQHRTLF